MPIKRRYGINRKQISSMYVITKVICCVKHGYNSNIGCLFMLRFAKSDKNGLEIIESSLHICHWSIYNTIWCVFFFCLPSMSIGIFGTSLWWHPIKIDRPKAFLNHSNLRQSSSIDSRLNGIYFRLVSNKYYNPKEKQNNQSWLSYWLFENYNLVK